MGNYHQHLIFGYLVALVTGVFGYFLLGFDLIYCILACMLGTFAALLPDLDHDQSTPLKEVFNVAAAISPFLIITALMERGFTDMVYLTAIFGGAYLFIRIIAKFIFSQLTTHRGMFHSIPALIIVGQIIYILYFGNVFKVRLFLAVAGALGFLSHLVLDEVSSVDFDGGKVTKNKFFGTALDFHSKSLIATGFTYVVMLGLFCTIFYKMVKL